MKSRRWEIAPANEEACAQLARQFDLPPLLARCLANRVSHVDAAEAYLYPRLARLSDPFLLGHMDRAVERLFRAHSAAEPIVIFGDYDVDGVTSTAILTEFLQRLGWKVSNYLPHRLEEGYGLSRDGIQNCLARFPVNLVLAVDCGSTSGEVIAELACSQVEVIVLDHHQICDPSPGAIALVNPRQPGTPVECADLCSAGLAFKLAHALLKRARALGWPHARDLDLRQFLDLAALGTIADLVPLTGENRILARCGLERLASTQRSGLIALKQVSGVTSPVTPQQVAFQLAPRLNAAGRLETALAALDLLLTTDPPRAAALASALDTQNRERQALEEKIANEAIATVRTRFDPLRDFAIVEGDASWHLGVVGIVAARVLREFHRPVVILGGDGSSEWRGSGRSIEGLDLAAALRNCADLLLKHGGHAMAAGVTLAAENLASFRNRLNDCVRATLDAEALNPRIRLDAEVRLRDLTFASLKTLDQLEPTGQGNPPVQLAARRLQLRGEPRRVGAREQHLRFVATDGDAFHPVLWWNAPPEDEALLRGIFDLAFAPELNEFNGTFGIQLKLLDLQPSA